DGLWVDDPFTFLVADAQRTKALLREQALGLAQRDCLCLGVPALGEIPEPLFPAPADDRDHPASVQELEHQRHLAASPPVARFTGDHQVGFELAREQRPAALQLAQQVTAKPDVLLQELVAAPLPLVLDAAPPHPGPDQREVLDRPDEGAPLEQLPLLPEQAVELGSVVRSEPAPEDELLRRRDG